MAIRTYRYFMGDFETTVFKGQRNTEVWASACVELYTENVLIFHSIDEQFEYLKSLNDNIIIYYHNLKFDGAFWLDYLMRVLQLKQATLLHADGTFEWRDTPNMFNNTFKYSISDKGMWYSITIKVNNRVIEIRDSLKLLPFSVRRIGEAFKTKHRKLDMEYEGFRYAGCDITDEEKEYIANDVLVVKEALEIMFDEGHNSLTIGACCLKEFKSIIGEDKFKDKFPDMYEIPLDETYDYANAGEYIRRSYKGGWCYLAKGKEGIHEQGLTADVNSLYPSMMSSESGNLYPVGRPTFWKGNDEFTLQLLELCPDLYYFIRIRTRFYLKPNKLPFIQIKNTFMYNCNECLETSDIYDAVDGKYYAYYYDKQGNKCDTRVTLTLTMTDYKLFLEHYDVKDFEILDGCWFETECGLFDGYIEKYKKIKITSKGAKRELAKLFLNNLYGKMASSKDSSFKYAFLKEDGSIGFQQIYEQKKNAGYIPIGSAITSYARNFTIRTAQANYYGKDKRGFIYADTDSIHCDLKPEELKNVPIHATDFCHWKLESYWDIGQFTRQKTYIEHVTHEDGEEVTPYYNIKCAGMPDKCKDLFELSLQGYTPTQEDIENERFDEQSLEFLTEHRTIEDFKVGLQIWGKLLPKRIEGGIVLEESYYTMR